MFFDIHISHGASVKGFSGGLMLSSPIPTPPTALNPFVALAPGTKAKAHIALETPVMIHCLRPASNSQQRQEGVAHSHMR